jgi:oxygen-dependent protoporphyrinogen oxidase
MQSLPEAIVSRLNPPSLLTNTTVTAVQPSSDGWTVLSSKQSEHFDGAIIALPRTAAALILRDASLDLSAELAAIQYSSSITVGLAYDLKVRQSLPPGFGFLIPRSEGKRLLAATFVHNKFPQRAPEDRALLRCFFAANNAEQVWDLSDSRIVDVVREELQQILGPQIIGLRHDPLFARVYKWKSAMAQYGVGHLEQLKKIESLRKALPGLALAGNGYGGIGVPDCVRSGRDAVKELLA